MLKQELNVVETSEIPKREGRFVIADDPVLTIASESTNVHRPVRARIRSAFGRDVVGWSQVRPPREMASNSST